MGKPLQCPGRKLRNTTGNREKGLGKWLMECILSHPDLQKLHRWVVVTRDVRLYIKVGFTPLKEPETYLEMVNPEPKPQSWSLEVG